MLFRSVEFFVNHMAVPDEVRRNISIEYYEAGHMMYVDRRSLADLDRDVTAFVQSATARRR